MDAESKIALRRFIETINPNVALTLHFKYNTTPTEESIKGALRAWDARINRKLLGKDWLQKKEQHINWVACIEKRTTSPHVHIAVAVPEKELGYFEAQAEITWLKIRAADHGDKAFRMEQVHDADGWVRYITKSIRVDQWIFSGEFK